MNEIKSFFFCFNFFFQKYVCTYTYRYTKSLKNHLKKLHTYGSWELFFLCSPNCQNQSRTSFPFYEFFYLTISARISGFMQLKQIDLVNFSLLKRLQLGSNCGFYCWNSEKKTGYNLLSFMQHSSSRLTPCWSALDFWKMDFMVPLA